MPVLSASSAFFSDELFPLLCFCLLPVLVLVAAAVFLGGMAQESRRRGSLLSGMVQGRRGGLLSGEPRRRGGFLSLENARRNWFFLLLLAAFFGGGSRMRASLVLSPVEELLLCGGPQSGIVLTGTLESISIRDSRAALILRDARAELPGIARTGLFPDAPGSGRAELPPGSGCADAQGEPGNGDAETAALGRIRVSCAPPPAGTRLYAGCPVTAEGKLALFEAASNPGQFDFRLYYRAMGIRYRMSAGRVEFGTGRKDIPPAFRLAFALREAAGTAIDRVFLPEDAGLFRAVLLGDRSALDEDTAELFRDGGIFHLMAVSATHIAVIFSTFYGLLRRLGLGYGGAGLITAVFLLLYGVLTGFGPSVFRAVVMALCRFLAAYLGRTYDLLSALALSMLLISAGSPLIITQSGFQLSFTAVAAIGIDQELRQEERTARIRRTGKMPPKRLPLRERLSEALRFSAFLQFFLLPVTLYWFYSYPPYGILLNLAVIPLLSLALGSGFTAAALYAAAVFLPAFPGMRLPGFGDPVSPGSQGLVSLGSQGLVSLGRRGLIFLANAFAGPGHYVFRLYRGLCRLTAALPFSLLTPGRPSADRLALYAIFLALLVTLLHRRAVRDSGGHFPLGRAAALAVPALLLLFVRPVSGLTVTFADVGQGDCVLLRTPETVILSDCGSSTTDTAGKMRLDPLLRSQGITRLDTVLMSHADEDHVNGLRWLLAEDDKITVGRLVMPAAGRGEEKYEVMADLARKKGAEVLWASRGSTLRAGALTLECLHPFAGENSAEGGRNEDSLVFTVRYGSFSLLLTGDLEIAREEELLEASAGPALPEKVTFLKAGHHGSAGSSSAEFLLRISPEYAVISVGRGNRYGHPAKEALERLENAGAGIFRTDMDGAVIVRTDGKRVRVQTFSRRRAAK